MLSICLIIMVSICLIIMLSICLIIMLSICLIIMLTQFPTSNANQNKPINLQKIPFTSHNKIQEC